MTVRRIGFACKFLLSTDDRKDKLTKDQERLLNTSATTVAWLNRQSVGEAEDRLWAVAKHNLNSVKNMLARVAKMPVGLRMVRLSSDLLPMYTESKWGYFWQQPDVRQFCNDEFLEIGRLARAHDIRLSFHPGQFCVLASHDADIVRRSVEEFEYHVDMARSMGYGSSWHNHGFKINVHISGREGPSGVFKALQTMTPEARNLITIENEEMRWGLDDCLALEDSVALVLDIHHHLIHSRGEYIRSTDDRWKRVLSSWRGVRPTMHYSLAREDVMLADDAQLLPNVAQLIETGEASRAALRAHSNDVWHHEMNSWALEFWNDADIMVEAKWKNVAAKRLFEQAIAQR